MQADTLLAGYILRIAVRRHRWHITLHDPRTGEVWTFRSFAALHVWLERTSSRPPACRCNAADTAP